MTQCPVLVEVTRNEVVESQHRGSALVVDARGRVVFSVGEVARAIYPRSCLKFFQAIPLVQSGAAAGVNLSAAELAVACASHNAEALHVDCVTRWLARLGLGEADLECGASRPLGEAAARDLLVTQLPWRRVHHNCSGKHVGMLTLAKHLGVETRGYSLYSHPTQQAWLQCLSELVEVDARSLTWERDGCGLPAICLPLPSLALGFARFAARAEVATATVPAMTRILDALRQHPAMLAGSGRCCTAVLEVSRGSVVVKTGAEGVYGGCIPHKGLGFALKIDDGASRASEVALGALLKRIGALDAAMHARLAEYFQPRLLNSQGWQVGVVRPSVVWDEL